MTHQQSDTNAGNGAEDSHLHTNEKGTDRELGAGDPERHTDTDLTPLCFHDAADEVECREASCNQDEASEHVPELLVVVDVFVQHSVGGGVFTSRHRRTHAELAHCGTELRFDGITVSSVSECEDEIVDVSRPSDDVLGNAQRKVERCEVACAEDAPLGALVEEVFGRRAETDVFDGPVAADSDHTVRRQVPMIRELRLQHTRH